MQKNFSKMVTNPHAFKCVHVTYQIIILDGDYMVRSSSSSSNFALTVRWNKSSFHFIIIKQGSKWILDDDQIKFESSNLLFKLKQMKIIVLNNCCF